MIITNLYSQDESRGQSCDQVVNHLALIKHRFWSTWGAKFAEICLNWADLAQNSKIIGGFKGNYWVIKGLNRWQSISFLKVQNWNYQNVCQRWRYGGKIWFPDDFTRWLNNAWAVKLLMKFFGRGQLWAPIYILVRFRNDF